MKVCLYLEAEELLKKSGIGVALKNQKVALERAGVDHTTRYWDDYDVLHMNSVFPISLAYAKLAKKRGKKVIMHAHTLEEDTRNSYTLSTFVSPVIREYLKYAYSIADHVVCPSEYTKDILGEYNVDVPITAISNGVDLDTFKTGENGREDYRERYSLEGTVPFTVGHVFLRKGVETFTNVARDFDNQFVWFGNKFNELFTEGWRMHRTMRDAPENVMFTGYVDDILAAYSAGDIFFFPTTAETQGIVILEAWAMGKPVLTRDLEVFQGWTHHGKDCLLAKDDDEFKELLGSLIEDEGLRKRLIKGGLKRVKEHTAEKTGKRLKKVYEEVLDG
jgi:1,2-diacylglycerol-3-alpha-glucose alpha-1,2-glucosyltransferase